MDSIQDHSQRQNLPVRAVQFGEGNFLRAFIDYMLDVANERGVFQGSVAVVKPRRGVLPPFASQDNLYTVVLRGRENGRVVSESRVVSALSSVTSPYDNPATLSRLAALDSLEFIFSNTTEAGIALSGNERLTDAPADSFPGKLLQLLYARFLHFSGDPQKGVTVLPTELIERNGDVLRDLLLTLAGRWALPAGFSRWLESSCLFCNTLVDRIVTGCPAESDALRRSLPYEDALLDVAEPFALWVIECADPDTLAARLPLDKIGLPVVFTRDLTPYRERKIRILNGAHTASVLAAFLAGEDVVRGMMHRAETLAFVRRVVFDELLPTVPLPEAEVRRFAEAVMERFDNPFIDHRLLAISLNSISKWRARILPALKDHVRSTGSAPRLLCFSLAALIAFYAPVEREDDHLIGLRDNQPYPICDQPDVLDFFWTHRGSIFTPGFVGALAAREDFWGENLGQIDGLTDSAAQWLDVIASEGMSAALVRAVEARA